MDASGEYSLVSITELADVTTGNSNTVDATDDGQYPFFDRSRVIKRSDKYLFDCEAIIVPGEGQQFVPRYYCGKFDLHQRAYAVIPKESINGRFLFYSIIANMKHFEQVATGSTVKSLRYNSFETLKVRVPPRIIQDKIDSILTPIDELIDISNKINDYLSINLFFMIFKKQLDESL